MNGSAPNSSLHRAEEIGARTRDPLAGLGRGCPGRYVPGGREPAKMIQTDRVHVGEKRTDAIDAPAIAGPTQGVPVVDGVAPELSLRAEIIRGYAGDEERPLPFVQQEQLRVGPNVARVGGDEKGQVADQAQAPGAGMFLQPFALAEQQELRKTNLIDPGRQIAPGCGQSGRHAPDQLCRPFEVVSSVVFGFQYPEQGIIFQPVRLVVAELFKESL